MIDYHFWLLVLKTWRSEKHGVYRWLKYEETAEVGDRWSKPHVGTTSMHGLLELKTALMDDGKCFVGLDIDMYTNETIAGLLYVCHAA